MSAEHLTAAPTPNPDPSPDQADKELPAGIAQSLGVVHMLISFGQNLAIAFRQRRATAGVPGVPGGAGTPPGSSEIRQILFRITRGLLRAAALEEMLLQRAAAGRDVTSPYPRTSSCSSGSRDQGSRDPDGRDPGSCDPGSCDPGSRDPDSRSQGSRSRQPGLQQPEPDVQRLPTPEELATEVRRQPIGVTLAAICDDLGITPDDVDRASWDRLFLAIVAYRGNVVVWLRRVVDRCLRPDPARAQAAWPPASPPPASPPPASPPPASPASASPPSGAAATGPP